LFEVASALTPIIYKASIKQDILAEG